MICVKCLPNAWSLVSSSLCSCHCSINERGKTLFNLNGSFFLTIAAFKPNIHQIHPCWHRHRSVTSLLTSSAESLMLAMTPETSIRSFLKISQHRCDSPWICKVCGDCCYSKVAIDQQCAFINASKPSCVALISSNRGEKSRLLCRWLISAKMSPNWLCISSFTFTS